MFDLEKAQKRRKIEIANSMIGIYRESGRMKIEERYIG